MRSARVPLLYPCRYAREKLSVRESDCRCPPLAFCPKRISVGRAHHHRKRMHSIRRFRTKPTFRRNILLYVAFAEFFPPRQNTEKLISRIADKSPTKQNIRQAHDMSRVRRVSPFPTVRDRPGSSPASFPGHGWSQKAPCITRTPFVQSTEPTHRHRRDQYEIVSYFRVVDGFVARQVVYSHAGEVRSPLY